MKSGADKHSVPNYSVGEPLRCVWMLGGVVDYKLCDREYDCEHCPFDSALGESPTTDEDKVLVLDGQQVEAMKGWPKELLDIQGYRLMGSLFYHPRHIWARIEEGGKVRMGLDDFGQKLVGRVYAVKLPQPGEETTEESRCWKVVHRAGETSLTVPVEGVIHETNGKLLQLPSLINHDPYGQGWAMVVQPTSLVTALKRLYYGQKSLRWFRAQVERLRGELQSLTEGPRPDVGTTLADGGRLVRDLARLADTERLQMIIDHFLSASSSDQPDSGESPIDSG